MANVELKSKQVTVLDEIVLRLSVKEALALAIVTSNVGGSPDGLRGGIEAIGDALKAQGISGLGYGDSVDGSIYFTEDVSNDSLKGLEDSLVFQATRTIHNLKSVVLDMHLNNNNRIGAIKELRQLGADIGLKIGLFDAKKEIDRRSEETVAF